MADQLTLFQTGGTDYAHLITTGTPGFSDLPTALTNYDAKNWSPIRALGRGGNEGALATLEFRGSEKIVTERNIDNLLLSLSPIKLDSGPVKHETKNWPPITALVGGGTEGALAPLEFGGSEKITEREIDTILLGLLPIKQ